MLSDDKYLTHVLQLFDLLYRKELVHVVDKEDRFIFISDAVLPFAKVPRENIIGKTFYEVFSPPPENIDSVAASIHRALATKEVQRMISVNVDRPNTSQRILLVTHSPLVNPDTDNALAVNIRFDSINFPCYFHHLLLKSPKQFVKLAALKEFDDDALLSRREHEIAFLLFYCRSVEQITQIINLFSERQIASKTIQNVISQQLYPKFQVQNQEALLEQLRKMEYHKKIPSSLLFNFQIYLNDL